MPFLSRSLRVLSPLLALAVVCPASVSAQSVKTPADWDLKVSHTPKGLPVKGEAWLPDDDNYAWQAARYLEGYLSLARVTGDRKYMNDSREILDYMLANRDDLRFAGKPLDAVYNYAPTYYLFHRGTPAKGWRRKGGPKDADGRPTMNVSVLVDGRICEMFVQWCELARQGFPGVYEADINRYLDRVQETIEMHMPSFSDVIKVDPVKKTYHATLPAGGFRTWWHVNTVPIPLPPSDAPRTWSGQIPLNQSMTMARAMLGYDHLRGTKVYREKIQLVVNFFLNSIDPAVKDRALWEYDPARKDRFDIEDVGHASIDLSLVEAAYRTGGYGIDDALIRRLVKTFHAFYHEPTHDVYFNISGPKNPGDLPRKNYGERTAIGFASWLWLAEFDPTIASKVRATYEDYFTESTSGFVMGGWGNLLYAESVIAGKAAIVLPKTPTLKPAAR
jgi:hypothetical protein